MGEDLKPIGTLYFKSSSTGEYIELTKISEMPELTLINNGARILAIKRRYIRHQAKFGGCWLKRKLHFNKNGRDNLYYEWKNWWEA